MNLLRKHMSRGILALAIVAFVGGLVSQAPAVGTTPNPASNQGRASIYPLYDDDIQIGGPTTSFRIGRLLVNNAIITSATITTSSAGGTLGNTRVSGTLDVTGATSLTTTLRVGGALTAASTVGITGVLTPTGGLASARVHGTTNLDGTTSAGVVNLNGLATLARARLTTATISGGSIDATIIGGTTPAAGSFTSLDGSGSATFIGSLLANTDFRIGGTGRTSVSDLWSTRTTIASGASSTTLTWTGVLNNDQAFATINDTSTTGAGKVLAAQARANAGTVSLKLSETVNHVTTCSVWVVRTN